MAEMSRDEKLIMLQEATGMDFDTCSSLLESTDWDLELTMSLAEEMMGGAPAQRDTMSPPPFQQHAAPPPTRPAPQPQPAPPPAFHPAAAFTPPPQHVPVPASQPPPAQPRPQTAAPAPAQAAAAETVVVKVQWMDDILNINIPASNTVAQLKDMLAERTGVSTLGQQLLSNFVTDFNDSATIGSLKLPASETLMLISEGGDDDDRPQNPSSGTHPSKPQRAFYNSDSDGLDSEDSEMEYYSDDDGFTSNVQKASVSESQAMREPLISDTPMPAADASRMFVARFKARYGRDHTCPNFYEGTFNDAVSEARRQGKVLCAYVHSDVSVETNIFCQETLCSSRVLDLLQEHFVVWGWDITKQPAHELLLDMTKGAVGQLLPIRGPEVVCPLMAVIIFGDTSEDVQCIKLGFDVTSGFIARLMALLEDNQARIFQNRLVAEERERERLDRLRVQEEQDTEYKQSLEEDRRKSLALAEQQKREEAERQKAEQEERDRLAKEEEEERQRQAKIDSYKQRVSAEPAPDTPQSSVYNLRFRLPDGSNEARRFAPTTTVEDLIVYVGSLGYFEEDYQLVINYPKRVVNTTYEPATTLKEAKFSPRDTVIVEAK